MYAGASSFEDDAFKGFSAVCPNRKGRYMDSYSGRRLELLNRLASWKMDFFGGKPWTIDPRDLRFKHGETITELKLPYHMGGEDEACIEEAVFGLASNLCKRYDTKMEGADATPMLLHTGALKPKTFRTDLFISGSLEKETASLALAGVPYIDSSILANWLRSDGHGRKFMKWVSGYFEKMMKEEARGEGERTAYLALLALINTIRKKKEKAKGLRIKGLPYEKADLATGLVMFLALRGGLHSTLDRLRDSGASSFSEDTGILLTSALVPKSFLSIPATLLSNALNPYGINEETFEAVSKVAAGLGGGLGIEEMVRAAVKAAGKDPEVNEAVRAQACINIFRRESLAFLSEFDQPSEAQSTLFEIYCEDRLIKNFLSDQRHISDLWSGLEETRKMYAADRHRNALVLSFQKFLEGFRKSRLGSLLKRARGPGEEAAGVIEGYYACAFDDLVESYAGPMRNCLADRREELKHSLLVEEYGRGRLYRFSVDDRPVLKGLAVEEEGQLFIDMKDFSRRTLKVREIAMADFMREHFYKPILDAASKYGMGSGVGADERGIRLANLPGDAAIFSGGVSYLVALARDIQNIIRKYREELLKKLPPRKEEELLQEVHGRFAARKDELKRKRAGINAALARNEPGVEERLASLGEEEHRVEVTYREELETAIKGELEAGLYIAYGAKAETLIIETRQGFSEPVSVSIGGKINEASRGTFRNPLVRAKLERSIENERMRRGNRGLKYPFNAYIDRVCSVKLPPELDSAFEKLVFSKKATNLKAMAQVLANEFLNDVNRIISGEPFSNLKVVSPVADIYNKGEVLSLNALEAYMKEGKGSKWFFRKSVMPDELHPSIREAFFFPFEPLDLWFSHEQVKGADRVEAFCRIGEVIFKGFEEATPMPVYEIVNSEGDFFKALMKHHFKEWREEAHSCSLAEGV